MLADYFTKPLQGSLFIRLCNHIMGAEFEDGDPKTHRSVLEYQDDHENKEASKRDQEASRKHPNGTRMKWKTATRNSCHGTRMTKMYVVQARITMMTH